MSESNYVTRIFTSPAEVNAQAWDALLQSQALSNPFMRHAYLAALHSSDSACPTTGWTPYFITLESRDAIPGTLVAGCVIYIKNHSYGEYVFDWAWANAYRQHGMAYYPKAVVAVPFTPVPGARLLARNAHARRALLDALVQWCKDTGMSSLHLLFGSDDDMATCANAGIMLRQTVQFHWTNT